MIRVTCYYNYYNTELSLRMHFQSVVFDIPIHGQPCFPSALKYTAGRVFIITPNTRPPGNSPEPPCPNPLLSDLRSQTHPPTSLRRSSAVFKLISRNYALRDEESVRILEEGMGSLQRARLAREAINKEGTIFLDGKSQLKPHPLLVVERDARAAALAAFRQLNLELPKSTSKRQLW